MSVTASTVFTVIEWVCLVVWFAATAARYVLTFRGQGEAADRIAWRTGWVLPVGLILCAVESNIAGHRGPAAAQTLLAALGLWEWWNRHRRRRRKLAEKVTGVVRDLGHRLTVDPVPVGAQ